MNEAIFLETPRARAREREREREREEDKEPLFQSGEVGTCFIQAALRSVDARLREYSTKYTALDFLPS